MQTEESPNYETVEKSPTLDELREMRSSVAERLARAEAADPGTDPIGHRLDEYRACVAELDEWISELYDEEPEFGRVPGTDYCVHGTFIGDPFGADHLCGWCEDGVSRSEFVRIQDRNARVARRASLLMAESVHEALLGVLDGLPYEARFATAVYESVVECSTVAATRGFVVEAAEQIDREDAELEEKLDALIAEETAIADELARSSS